MSAYGHTPKLWQAKPWLMLGLAIVFLFLFLKCVLG